MSRLSALAVSQRSVVILLSVALGVFVHPYWFYFTAFVGLNLLQSAFSGWCPMMTILRKAGLKG